MLMFWSRGEAINGKRVPYKAPRKNLESCCFLVWAALWLLAWYEWIPFRVILLLVDGGDQWGTRWERAKVWDQVEIVQRATASTLRTALRGLIMSGEGCSDPPTRRVAPFILPSVFFFSAVDSRVSSPDLQSGGKDIPLLVHRQSRWLGDQHHFSVRLLKVCVYYR